MGNRQIQEKPKKQQLHEPLIYYVSAKLPGKPLSGKRMAQ